MERIRGVVFDLDGTLVQDQHDYNGIRLELGIPHDTPLLEAVESLPASAQEWAQAILLRHEREAAESARVIPGVHAFLDRLGACGIRQGVLTRNSRATAALVLSRVGLSFDPVVAREDAAYKPNPAGLVHICQTWNLPPSEVLMIGDYQYDLLAGRGAGTRTALITHGRELPFSHLADIAFDSFENVPEKLMRWIDGCS
jgi:HAD superfamily hydrolase (TIGR01549 family)